MPTKFAKHMPPNPLRPLPAKDRRSGADRRRVDLERFDRPERRHGVEARKPEVIEREMTNSEWLELSAEPVLPPPIKMRRK